MFVDWRPYRERMMMLFSSYVCTVAANINRLVLSFAKHGTLWSFAVLWRGVMTVMWKWFKRNAFFSPMSSFRQQNPQWNYLQRCNSSIFPLRMKVRSIQWLFFSLNYFCVKLKTFRRAPEKWERRGQKTSKRALEMSGSLLSEHLWLCTYI